MASPSPNEASGKHQCPSPALSRNSEGGDASKTNRASKYKKKKPYCSSASTGTMPRA